MSKAKMDFKTVLKRYYRLSKPGIVYANTLTAVAGYLYGTALDVEVVTLVGLTAGIALLIAGACAYNNYMDRGIDAAMQRTQKRGLVTGDIKGWQALGYATLATGAGLLLLAITQNRLTLLLAVIAFIDYVVLYGVGKRKTVHGTLIGTVSGAMSLVIGYVAVSNQLDVQAWLLFAIMFAWQMAHFYAIALYRLEDYDKAHIPVMPAVYGVAVTKLQTVMYIGGFIVAVIALMLIGDLHWLAGTVLTALGSWWLWGALRSYSSLAAREWGRQAFLHSLRVVMAISICIALGTMQL